MIKFEVVEKNKSIDTCYRCNKFCKSVNLYSLDDAELYLCKHCVEKCESIINYPAKMIIYLCDIESRLRDVENKSSDHYGSGY